MPEVTEAILHDLQPGVIEMYLYYPGGGHGASGVPQSPKRSALRFPVASGAWKEAQSAIAQYRGDTPRRADFFHGKGDGSDPEDLTQCYHCGYETFKLMSHCPQCGRAMQSKRWSRRYGWALVSLGAIISGVMTFILYDLIVKLHSGAVRISGGRTQEKLGFAVMGLVDVFGFTAFFHGIWQIVTGRRSKWVIYFAIAIAVILGLFAVLL